MAGRPGIGSRLVILVAVAATLLASWLPPGRACACGPAAAAARGAEMGHHYTPQKYLEGFRDPGRLGRPMIWQFDKKTGKSSWSSIKNVANEPGFYTAQDEALLNQQVERPANPVLDKLRARAAISAADRALLVPYIATMLTRIPRLRRFREELAPQAVRESCEDYRALIRKQAQIGTLSADEAQSLLHEADEFERRCTVAQPEFVLEQIKRPWPTPRIVDLVGDMAWRFVATKGPTFFITGDDPGSFFHGFGLGHPKAELIFPVSSEVALHASWQEGPWNDVRPITQWLVREFNRRIALGATRFIYSRERADWLAKVLRNRVEQLSRIEW